MRFEDLNWFDVQSYLTNDDRLMLVFGSCEQHAYLSLLTDVAIPLVLADAASKITGIPIAPPLNFGSSPYFLGYPGTLSLRASTLLNVVEDLIRSAHGQGFTRFLIINGHGGNEGAKTRLYELANELPGIRISWYAWWQSHSVIQIAQKHELKSGHASWLEAFSFVRVSDLPSGEKKPPAVTGLMNKDDARQIYEDGSFGGPYSASEEIMQEIFSAALEDILLMLEFN